MPTDSYTYLGRFRQPTFTLSRSAFDQVLQRPCARHNARPGEGCWSIPSGVTARGSYPAACGTRVAE